MRDLETVEAALKIAETGHLTFGTLHTNSAAQTINRIIDMFPADQQSQIRTQLSLVLEGIVCQALLPRADGKGRVVSLEILVPNAGDPEPDSRRQDSSDLRRDADRPGEARHADDEPVAREPAHEAADHARGRDDGASSNRDELQDMINRGVGVVAGAGLGPPAGTTGVREAAGAELS